MFLATLCCLLQTGDTDSFTIAAYSATIATLFAVLMAAVVCGVVAKFLFTRKKQYDGIIVKIVNEAVQHVPGT